MSEIFLNFRKSFLIYGEYCANMTGATDTLREVTKKNALVDQLVQVSLVYFFFFSTTTTIGRIFQLNTFLFIVC